MYMTPITLFRVISPEDTLRNKFRISYDEQVFKNRLGFSGIRRIAFGSWLVGFV